jgi:hypothetical protein
VQVLGLLFERLALVVHDSSPCCGLADVARFAADASDGGISDTQGLVALEREKQRESTCAKFTIPICLQPQENKLRRQAFAGLATV